MSKKRDDSAETVTPELPPGWCWTTLGELLDGIEAGKSFKCDPRKASQYEWGVIKVSAMTWGEFDEEENKVIPPSREIDPHHEIRSGDLLLSRSNTVELVGATVLVRSCRRQLVLSDKSMRLLVPPAINRGWLQKILSSPPARQQLSAVATGTSDSMRNVSQEKVLAVRLLLPPATEQTRILTRLEELLSDLDAGVAALEQTSAKLKRYRAAVLKAAVHGRLTAEWRAQHPATEPASKLLDRILAERRKRWEADKAAKFSAAAKAPPGWRDKYVEPTPPDAASLPSLPEGWNWTRLDQLIVYLRNGYFQKPSDEPVGMRLLRINAVRPMNVDLEEVRYLSNVEGDVSGYFVEDGDLLFTRYNGSVDLLGVAGVVRGSTQPTLHPDKLIRVKAVPFAPLADYLEIACNVGISRRHMEGRARTTAGQTGISGADIREMPIPLPPLSEQEKIVSEVAERLTIISAAQQQIDSDLLRSSRLRQCILKQAFEGKLVPQDRNDEPASALLERIKAQRQAATSNGETSTKPQRGRKVAQ